MKTKDIIIAIIALILAYFIINLVLSLVIFTFRIAVILIAAYIVYLFLKKVL